MTQTPEHAPAIQPTLFIPHGGGPCFFMDWTLMGEPADTWNRTEAWLRGLVGTLPEQPAGIIVISGHWEEPEFTVASVAKPEMIYDYYGFPPHTYALQYPAPGSPDLAARIVSLLEEAGIPARTDTSRGYDHGVFVPFLLAFPDCTIPIVPLSLKNNLDPADHLAAGRALKALRADGVLIVGSGMSYHNMHAFRTPGARVPSALFDHWLTATVEAEGKTRNTALIHWAEGDAATNAHPREEHLLPLMVAAGAGEDSPGTTIFSDVVMQATISGFRFG